MSSARANGNFPPKIIVIGSVQRIKMPKKVSHLVMFITIVCWFRDFLGRIEKFSINKYGEKVF